MGGVGSILLFADCQKEDGLSCQTLIRCPLCARPGPQGTGHRPCPQDLRSSKGGREVMGAGPGEGGIHWAASGSTQIGEAQTWARRGFMEEVLPGPPLLGQIRWEPGAKR